MMATLFWIYYGEMKPNMIGDRYESVMVKRRLTIIEASSLYALPFMISSFALLLSPIAIGGIEIPSIVIFIIGCILIGWILIVIKKRLLALEA